MLVKIQGSFLGFDSGIVNYQAPSLKEGLYKVAEVFNRCTIGYNDVENELVIHDTEHAQTVATIRVNKEYKLLVNIQSRFQCLYCGRTVGEIVALAQEADSIYFENSSDWVKIVASDVFIYVFGDLTT